MKRNDVKASQNTILMATIADRLGAIMAWALGVERPPLFVRDLVGDSFRGPDPGEGDARNREIETYDSPEEFMRARYGE